MKTGFMQMPTAGNEDASMNEETTMNQYRYAVHEDETFGQADCFDSAWDENCAENVAKDAAAHYYSEMAGSWKSSNPISIQIFKEEGSSFGVFNVEYESDPYFMVHRID